MDDHTIERARDEAFRKIGRNVVNFQRMEAMLKLLVKLSGISGSASELEAKARKWHESVDRTSMGSLVKSLFESVFAEPREVASPEEVQEPWLSFRLVIELDESDNEQLKEALEMIVQERNVLVHQMLAKTDFQSVESCHELGKLLDQQRERAIPTYRKLQGLVKSAADARKQMADAMAAEIMKHPTSGPGNGTD